MSNHQCATPVFQYHWLMNQFTASRSTIGRLSRLHQNRTIWRTSPASATCCSKDASPQRANQRERAAAHSQIGRSTMSKGTQASGAGEDEMSDACWNGAVCSMNKYANGRKKKMRQNFGGWNERKLKRNGSPANIKEGRNDQIAQSCSIFSIFSVF